MKTMKLLLASLLALAIHPVYAADPIKIGAVISRTGPAAFLGEPQEITLKHYVGEINKSGGVLGRPLELVIYDDTSDANTTRTFATRLIEEDKVVAAMGASTTGGTLAIAPVFDEAKVTLISLAAGIEIVQPVRPFVFKMPHDDRMVCSAIALDMKARGYKNIALMTGTDGVGKSMRKECTAAAAAQGIKVIADENFNAKDIDMTPQLTKIKNTKGVDAVFVGGFGQPLAVVTRNYGQLGLPFPQYHANGSASKEYIQMAGPASERVRLPGPLLVVADKLGPNDPARAVPVAYAATYKKVSGKDASSFGGYSYDALMLIVNAIKRAGSSNPAAIRNALETTKNYMGVTGTYNLSPTDHNGLDRSSLYMVDIKNGDWSLKQ